MTGSNHSFYIPVMGIGFTIDTPLKVAQYGISSVISLVDDSLIESVRKKICADRQLEYIEIPAYDPDSRAKRITAYLNLLNRLVNQQFEQMISAGFSNNSDIAVFFSYLPDNSPLKLKYQKLINTQDEQAGSDLRQELLKSIRPGSIDVNIMVKLDKDKYLNGEKQSPEYSDAMSALRGFAQSELTSSIILSAGFNRRLTTYMESFEDFYPDALGYLKKRITLKVSDFRSAQTQSKLYARKGLWVSEYRIESGLNCGGHAFATEGELMGPILEDFKTKRTELVGSNFEYYQKAILEKKGINLIVPPVSIINAQGGVGTSSEHNFLRNYYQLESIGWGSPFLLVPESVNIDQGTLNKLASAGESDIQLSDISPLGVQFYTLVNSDSETARKGRIDAGRPGSSCTKGHVMLNTEFSDKPMCIASNTYQKLKIEALQNQSLSKSEYQAKVADVVVKACICKDLSGSVELNYGLKAETAARSTPAVCPGPNIAFFSKIASLKDMISHIYGRINLITRQARPHIFINELKLYMNHLVKDIAECTKEQSARKIESLQKTYQNLQQGIEYYKKMVVHFVEEPEDFKTAFILGLNNIMEQLEHLGRNNPAIFIKA